MKKLAALFLILSLLLGSTAFAGELSEYSQKIDLSVDYPVFWQKDISFPLVESPVNIKVLFRRNASHPESFENLWYVDYISKLTNINFEFELVEEGVWEDRKSLAFISGDYPDVFFANISADDEILYGYEGKLIDLLPLIKEHAPNIMALYEAYPDVVKGTMHENGAIYVLPMISYAPRSAVPGCTLVNQEWLTKLNAKIPTTTDELYALLKAIKETDLNGNGEQDEIPLSLTATKTNGQPENNFILYAFGFTDTEHDVIDGKYVYVPAQDNYRAYLTYMNKLYTEKLLDNDYFTQDDTQLKAKLSAGLVGMPAQAMTALVPNYENYIAVPALTSPENTSAVWPETSINYQRNVASMVITDKCPDPVAVIKYANYLVTTEASLAARLGPSQQESGDGYGYTYESTDGKHAFGATRSFPGEYASYYMYRMSKTPMFLPAYINPLVDDVVVGSDDKNNFATKLWQDSGVYGVRRTVYALQSTLNDEETSELAYYLDLDNYATQMRAKFITGEVELNDANWNEYLGKLKAYGMDDMCAIRQAGYDRYVALPSTVK